MGSLEANGESEFELVLEIEPWHFSDRPVPQVETLRAEPSTWDDYFRACLKDAGVPPLSPVRTGSRFVAVGQLLDHPLLSPLVIHHLDGTGLPGFADDNGLEDGSVEECVNALGGGVALIHGEKCWLEPAYCGDLSHVENWSDVIDGGFGRGTLWVGHPALHYEARSGTLTLRETRAGSEDTELNEVRIALLLAERQMARVRQQREQLEDVLRTLLDANPKTASLRDLAAYLVGKRD